MTTLIRQDTIFYLVLSHNKLSVRYPGFKAMPLVILGGTRAKTTFNIIVGILRTYGLTRPMIVAEEEIRIGLPWAAGLAVSFFLLALYNTLNPSKYAWLLEQILAGANPIASHLDSLINSAIELSGRMDEYYGNDIRERRQFLHPRAAKTISKNILKMASKRKPQNIIKVLLAEDLRDAYQ